MRSVNPYLNFTGNAREAFEFYRSVFGGEFAYLSTIRDGGGNTAGIPEAELDWVRHVSLPLTDSVALMGSDVPSTMAQGFTVGSNSYLSIETDDTSEAKRLYDGLVEGGSVEVPLKETDFAEAYASLVDKFGIRWLLIYEGRKRKESPA